MIMPGYKLIIKYRKDGKPLKDSEILSASLALFVVYFLSICNIMCVKLMEVFFLSAGMEKGIKYKLQDQSSIMLLFEHNFTHNAVVLRVRFKSIMLKLSRIMYLTQAPDLTLLSTGLL